MRGVTGPNQEPVESNFRRQQALGSGSAALKSQTADMLLPLVQPSRPGVLDVRMLAECRVSGSH